MAEISGDQNTLNVRRDTNEMSEINYTINTKLGMNLLFDIAKVSEANNNINKIYYFYQQEQQMLIYYLENTNNRNKTNKNNIDVEVGSKVELNISELGETNNILDEKLNMDNNIDIKLMQLQYLM